MVSPSNLTMVVVIREADVGGPERLAQSREEGVSPEAQRS